MSRADGTEPDDRRDDEFVPRGAIVFVTLLLLAYGAIWFFFYFLTLDRP